MFIKSIRPARFLMFLTTSMLTTALIAGPTATLIGRVTDETGAIIIGVKVDATNVQTNVVYPGETNEEGIYNIPNLPPGTYRVVVQKFAFRTVVKPDIELHVQDVIAMNFSMEVGSQTQSVTVEAGAPLIQANPARGGDFLSREVRDLPFVAMTPISLARTLPGVIDTAGSTLFTTSLYGSDYGEATQFSVNGQRPRANNYLLDSTENNDILFTGVAQPFNMADAVEEVSVQTGNFGVEFGRAGGGVFNVVTKAGTNSLHGTLLWRYQSQRFNSVANLDKRNGTPQSVFSRNVYGFTVGGPVRKNRTFFFAGFQEDSYRSTQNYSFRLPTNEAVTRLRSMFPSNPRLDLYLKFLGSLRGFADPSPLNLGRDPLTNVDRGTVQVGSALVALPASRTGPQWLARIDHNPSETHRLAFRYIYDTRTNAPSNVYFPGFITDQAALNHNFLFTDHYTFSPTWTNEFRFSFARQDADEPQRISPQSIAEARTQPRIGIGLPTQEIDSPGIRSELIQFRRLDNFLLQETQTNLRGRHTFSYGAEILRQFATQRGTAYYLGQFTYTAAQSLGYSAFANFLDDFSGVGTGGITRKDFGVTVFHPNQLRHSYFFQDVWLPAPSLSLTLGLRYENFGQVANALPYPAFAGFNPDDFLKPNRVNTDNNNFGPAFGLAWSPVFRTGWLHRLFGANKTVWRGGYQISYDAFFTQLLSLQLAASSPNGIRTDGHISDDSSGRGSPHWSEQLSAAPSAPSITDDQRGIIDKDLRSPYSERWSFGFQRQLSNRIMIDGSYVGSESHKLTTWDSLNPLQPSGQPLHPGFGVRAIRTSQGNSSYHAMQWSVDRRFSSGFLVKASYTWSKNIDSTSDGVGGSDIQSGNGNRTSVPLAQGGLKLDRGPSHFDRSHRATVVYVWDLPGPSHGFWKHPIGGWSVAGITSFQSGAPFTVLNAQDRNSDGEPQDRPDIGNSAAPLNTRATLFSGCPETGYRNPDTNACVAPGDVHWVQRPKNNFPNATTVGRNTLRTNGISNFDLSLTKSFQIAEQKKLDFRCEALNVFNHPQFTQVPPNALDAAPGRFLNRDLTNSGTRSMWVQLKLLF
jgi:Carboxypeptidase regulatory-like domain